jgi:hypothetical protein
MTRPPSFVHQRRLNEFEFVFTRCDQTNVQVPFCWVSGPVRQAESPVQIPQPQPLSNERVSHQPGNVPAPDEHLSFFPGTEMNQFEFVGEVFEIIVGTTRDTAERKRYRGSQFFD